MVSDRLDGESCSGGVGDLAGVGEVGGDDGVVAADDAFGDGDVDDVVVSGAGSQGAYRIRLVVGEWFGGAEGEESGRGSPGGVRLARNMCAYMLTVWMSVGWSWR